MPGGMRMRKSNRERELGSSKKKMVETAKNIALLVLATEHDGEGQKRDHGSIL